MNTTRQSHKLRVLVTRPEHQAGQLVTLVEQMGVAAVLLPLIEIVESENKAQIKSTLLKLDKVDTVVFISANAVKYALQKIDHSGLRSILNEKQIWAIGRATEEALIEHGIGHIKTPEAAPSSEALLAMPQMLQVKNSHILILQGGKGRGLLYDTLHGRGALVICLDVYRRQMPLVSADLCAVLKTGVDVIFITSGEALMHFLEMLSLENLHLSETVLLILGSDRIAKIEKKELNHGCCITASNPTDSAMAAALADWISRGKICQK